MTDTLDFEKITDEDLTIEGKDFFETDWLEHLIQHFQGKAEEFTNEHLEVQRRKQQEKDLMRKKTEAKLKGELESEEEDEEEDSPGEEESLN